METDYLLLWRSNARFLRARSNLEKVCLPLHSTAGAMLIAFLKLQDGQWDLIKAVPEKSDEGALLASELAQLKTSGIRKDNPQALTQALDPKTHPLAEAVRVRILNMEAQK
jgi:hypothetical protein